ncbi:MAG: GNAT superfamily N-acetyltransferase, partial [Thalassolituus oleivorans]
MSPAAALNPVPKPVFDIRVASEADVHLAQAICDLIETAAKIRGTGIAKRDPAYIAQKMAKGNAIIALAGGQLAGFCYIETWEVATYVANSGLIVSPDFRNHGLARRIKRRAFL